MLKLVALVSLAVATSAAQANIIYHINQSSTVPETMGELSPLSDTVMGTITTDGTIGAIQASNIVGYDLKLIDNLHPLLSSELTPLNSGIWYDTGNALIAGAGGLSFDFSKSGAVFIIQANTDGYHFSSGYRYFCFQTDSGPCLNGETIVPGYYAVDGVRATGFTGVTSLNSVPEPAAWGLMAAGFALMGGALRARRGMSSVAA